MTQYNVGLAYKTRYRSKGLLTQWSLTADGYRWYLYYVHGQQSRRTKMSDFLADTVQKFVEEDTGNA